MKLRLSKGQMRFRLTPKDLDQLVQQKRLEDRLLISSQLEWRYTLVLAQVSAPKVVGSGNEVRIELPEPAILEWAKAQQPLEWEFTQVEPALQVSIEKDVKPNRK